MPVAIHTGSFQDYFFRDGKRRIDFILVYTRQATSVEEEESRATVNSFLTKMENLGLQFETELASLNNTMTFIKVHTPLEVLYYHAKVHRVKLEKFNVNVPYGSRKSVAFNVVFGKRNIGEINRIDSEAVLSKRPTQPTNCERIFITHKIMRSYEDNVGYYMLLALGHLYSAYPMHDGEYNWSTDGKLNDRQLLNKYWSNFSVIYKQQPLDLINRYFGSAVAFYFAWMGFYIKALCAIFIFGVATSIYSVVSIEMPVNSKSYLYCHSKDILCAKCPHFNICPFTYLNASCTSSKWNFLLENDSVIFNAILMSMWGTLYFVFWRRYENTLSYRWDLFDLKAEVTFRAQYPRKTAFRRISKYTNQLEPYTPNNVKLFQSFIFVSVILVMILLVFIVLIGVIAFRVYQYKVTDSNSASFLIENMEMHKLIVGCFIAIIFILIFEMSFEVICMKLMIFMNPPTNKEFDENLIFTMFIFSFVNGFSHLFYGSFVKTHLYTYPGHKYNSFFAMITTDICQLDDCVLDICFQLIGILLATALLRTCREFLGPATISWYRYYKANKHRMYQEEVHVWEKDLYKSSFQRYNLVYSYKHIILQFGYITLFAAVFPITPLFSLLYNLVEIRADALKLIRVFRRPIPCKKKGIGAWNTILRFMTIISVITNTLIISFTSDFVVRIIEEKTEGIEKPHSMSVFATKDYVNWDQNKHKTPFPNLKQCKYFADRYSPNTTMKYEPRFARIFVISFQLLVFLVLEHIILFLTAFVEMFVPKMPTNIQQQMHKVRLLLIAKKEIRAERT